MARVSKRLLAGAWILLALAACKSESDGALPAKAKPADDGKYEVDLLVLYTDTYRQRVGGESTARGNVEHLVSEANRYFVNSSMPIRYRAVGIQELAHATEADWLQSLDESLQFLADDPVVRAERDHLGADVVVLLRAPDYVGFANCGAARAFNQKQYSFPPANVDPDRDAFASIIVLPGTEPIAGIDGLPPPECADKTETLFAHELGHVLGGGHQHPDTGWRPYAAAAECGIAGDAGTDHVGVTYYTIMYGNKGVSGDVPFVILGEPKIDFFSSPTATWNGIPCGREGDILPADNARAMTEAAPYVAAYRQTKAQGRR